MTSPIGLNTSNLASAQASASSQAASSQSSINSLSDPNTFLKLLTAQLANQDPEQPADGTTFVTQLATFAGVEQQSQMRSDLDSINTVAQSYSAAQAAAAAAIAPATSSSSTTPSTTGTSATGSSN